MAHADPGPAQHLPIEFERARTALVLIEFQKEWLAAEGTLRRLLVRDRDALRTAAENAGAVLDAARTGGWTVAHAGLDLRHDPDYQLFAGGRRGLGLRAAIPKAGTWTGEGADFVEPFVPRPGEFRVAGRSGASALKNATLDPFLRNNRIDTLLFMGFATHVCVESTLRDAHDLGYDALLVHDACAAFDRAQHDHVRRHVVPHFGAEVAARPLAERLRAG
jgi:nicotinamidase-related amidase